MKTIDEIRDIFNAMPEDRGAELLDDIVHDICSNMASAINNSGVDDQINFIKENLGAADAVREILQMLPKDNDATA